MVAVAADFGGSSLTRMVPWVLGGEGLCTDGNDLAILVSAPSIMIWYVLSRFRVALADSGLYDCVGNSVPRQDRG